jgi:hypothetical protein
MRAAKPRFVEPDEVVLLDELPQGQEGYGKPGNVVDIGDQAFLMLRTAAKGNDCRDSEVARGRDCNKAAVSNGDGDRGDCLGIRQAIKVACQVEGRPRIKNSSGTPDAGPSLVIRYNGKHCAVKLGRHGILGGALIRLVALGATDNTRRVRRGGCIGSG